MNVMESLLTALGRQHHKENPEVRSQNIGSLLNPDSCILTPVNHVLKQEGHT